MAKWVSDAWESISAKTIVAGFRKAGLIPCAADGDVEESDSSESEDDSDVPAVLQPEVAALFVSDSEEDDFDGVTSVQPLVTVDDLLKDRKREQVQKRSPGVGVTPGQRSTPGSRSCHSASAPRALR
ncbi:hypothetical protein HPB51_003568 [Rhipicephalus microplus]|uniref:DDE-1 domain-containing protein n=1 Tax=Rhipicephalus microplus TaxID=6941 RepID=A0A9J6E6N4_RHIMP|nr:hypothetical protein HPB51_003568 [Rhipicephalus microplus]